MRRAAIVLVFLGGCGDPVGPQAVGAPVARLEPPDTITIEPVAADAVAVTEVEVFNEGGGPLYLEAVSMTGARTAAWQVTTALALGEAIAPGAHTRINIEYRPCPALLAGGPLCDCTAHSDTATLSIKTNADAEPRLLSLSASGVAPGPRIGLEPAIELALGQATTGTITVRNVGCGVLQVRSADLSGPGGEATAMVDDFKMTGCEGWPCPLDLSLCEARCDQAQATLQVTYNNTDVVANEVAELHLDSNDPLAPERVLLVAAQGELTCLPPLARVETSTHPCIFSPVTLDAGLSEPSGPDAAITDYAWSMAFAQEPVPALMVSGDGRTAQFVPQQGGLYLVELEVGTACGPPETMIAQVIVADTGCH